MPNFVKYCIALAFLLAIGLCIYFISSGDFTAREAALLSMLLTILSIMATWVVTHIYTQSQHKRAIDEVQESHRTNLRTYALKASEKVNNLSAQLNRLSVYLEESLEYSDNENLRENFLVNQERIESSIHMINTLKSVNDTALSDWEGVIGDELDEQREIQVEREQEFERLVERLKLLSESQIDTQIYAQDSTEALSKELVSIRKDIRSMASSLGLTPIRLTKSIATRPPKTNVKNTCPECGQVIEYRQRSNTKSIKTLKCKSCGVELISTYDLEKEFILQKRSISQEQIACPTCNNTVVVNLDTFPNSSLIVECNSCHSLLVVTRTKEGVTVNKSQQIKTETDTLNDEIIELVKNNLPPQPWPTGTTKEVADKLGLPPRIVSEAITKLTLNGVFDLQYYGKLYVPKSKKSKIPVKGSQDGEM